MPDNGLSSVANADARRCIDFRIFRFVLSISLLSIGCADRRAYKTPDSWFNPPPLTDPAANDRLDGSRISEVLARQEAFCEERLADKPFVPLTDAEAEKLIGLPQRVGTSKDTRPYLIRGVYLIHGTGVFDVYRLPGGDIFVYHECIGDHAVVMRRRSLIVQLDEPPRHVYVACKMNEGM